ncbi:MAG: Two-component response regulator [Parcubacteria group bacterium GW2011_GWA2_36_10]|nr:MAG: Two-component response regulator [Parcubacteria group bacterium GW2011_GWA2_36_10]
MILNNFLNLLKKIPIDLGQANTNTNLRTTTKGKLIALNLVPEGVGKTALDVGCREGHQSKWLEHKGYQVTSIDQEKVYEQCQIVDINDGLPFVDNSFDLIWCSEVIEHLINPVKTIEEFERVLKPGGKMILTTPNSYFILMNILHLFGLSPQKLQNIDHKQFFHFKDIKILFPEAKIYGFFPYFLCRFKITSLVGLLSPTFVIEKAKKAIPN